MSIAELPATSRQSVPQAPLPYGVYAAPVLGDPIHDVRLIVVAAPDAPLGDIQLTVQRGIYDVMPDYRAHVNAVRRFIDHLSVYADELEAIAAYDGPGV